MYYAYIIETIEEPKHWYVGSAEDTSARLADHNAGRSPHTSKYRPWQLVWYCAFPNRARAESFEHYLKTASGRAFQKKHIAWTRPHPHSESAQWRNQIPSSHALSSSGNAPSNSVSF